MKKNEKSKIISIIDKPLPKISIIIALFNGEKFLESTLNSIINQSYPNIELIVIDGGSTDNSIEILRKYNDKIDYWISEKDQGISDAFNKGIKFATGTFINFQGDGDGFIDRDSVANVFKSIEWDSCKLISARIARVDLDNNLEYNSAVKTKFRKSSLLFKMSLPHQGLFTHIDLFKEYGLFDLNNKYCMDYEHLLRAYNQFPKVALSDVIVARWRNDGLGNGKELEVLKEYHSIKIKNKVKPIYILHLIHFWILLKYKIKSILGRL